MQFPEQTYRWLVSTQIIPNEGQMVDKNLVAIPPPLAIHFDSGYNIAEIVKSIMLRSGQKPSSSLDNVRKDTNKNVKLTNWNFIWLSFDDLRMVFDTRIKDLILQGESALIVEIVKQLADRDENKNEQAMRTVVLKGKSFEKKMDKTQKTTNKHSSSLDIKKINLQKDPNDSESSLEFLILLLAVSFNMSVEEILGLFTNQNKYLAHIIVKGINDDFSSVILFYTLLNKNNEKLRAFIEDDQKDAESCLYAIKPGFISKDPTVSLLTIQLFSKLGDIYHWLISDVTRGSTTLLLGVKRHPQYADKIFSLMSEIINENDIQFYTKYYKPSFKDSRQMIEITKQILAPMGENYLKDKLLEIGVMTQWIEIAINFFNSSFNSSVPVAVGTDDRVLVIGFLGELMLNAPNAVLENEECLYLIKRDWKQKKWIDFIQMIDEMFNVLRKLAKNRSSFASKMYQIIIEIFQQISDIPTKKQYLVQNFKPIVEDFPKMPTHFFIEAYQATYFDAIDLSLLETALEGSDSVEGLVQIGEVLLKMFANSPIVNVYLGSKLYSISRRVLQDEIGQAFIKKAIKDCLNAYSAIEITKQNPRIAKPQPMYFNYKGNSQKISKQGTQSFLIKQKQASNLLTLAQKLALLSKSCKTDTLETQIREQLLDTNAYIRKNNFKVSSKGIAGLLRKFGISKEDQNDYDDEYRNKKSIASMEESIARKKNIINNLSQMAASRVGGPEHLRKQFSDIVEKRKKQEEERRLQEEKKQKEETIRKTLVKKQIQKMQLLRGFGSGEAELKEQGFWSRFVKEQNKDLELYPPELMQQRDIDYIDNLFKKFHRVLRFLFLKYTASMYSIKSVNNFEDNQTRKELINTVQLIKFLKDYKLFFLTSNNQVQNLVRDINVKLQNKRENQDLDFSGFEHFIIQFGAIIFTKTHTVNTKTSKGQEQIKKSMLHVSHWQLVEEIFNYLKLVFTQKGEKTTIFDEPQAAYFNEADVIKEFTKKIEENPDFILPEGYKKITDKTYTFVPKVSENVNKNVKNSYIQVLEILDQIFFQSSFKFHLIEPIMEKITKVRVKPHAFTNVKAKLMSDTLGETKNRAMSSIVQRKVPSIPPMKMMQRKVLSFGMKLGLSYVNYKDKLLGQQVAFVIDDMLTAIENGKTTIQREKVLNQAVKRKKQMEQMQRKIQTQKQRKRKERKQQLQKMKKQITQKKEKELEDTKQQRQKKKQKQMSREKKKREDMEKYLTDQKAKLKEKKEKQEQEKSKLNDEKKKKKSQEKKAREKFKQFNEKQIQRLKKSFDQTAEQKKKSQEQMQEEKKHKEDLYKKLRNKISSQDKKIIELRNKNNEQISELYGSPEISQIFKKFEPNLKALFDFLIKNTYTSITQRKHNNEIILRTWNYFGIAFQLNPLIIQSKEITNIFRTLTKDKQIRKQYYLGLNFEQFQQALLRITIKHKSIFNKISEKIKEDDMSQKEIDAVIEKDIEEKEKNQFEEPKQIDVKGLLVEEDINKEIIDDYGDISKVTATTLKGLIYYLKVPNDKVGQDKRFRQVLAAENLHVQKYQKLREVLNEEYSLQSPVKKKDKNSSMQKSSESIK